MGSRETVKRRKMLEEKFKKEANLITGQLTKEKDSYNHGMEELQKQCSHIWDNGENAMQKAGKINICTICRKKIEI